MPIMAAGTAEVLALCETFQGHCDDFGLWLAAGEESMRVCGPIQADLPRLEEQEPLLEVCLYVCLYMCI